MSVAAPASASFGKDDYVYYASPTGDTVPARVLKAGQKKVLIAGDFPESEGGRRAWVSPKNLQLQSEAQ